MPVQIKNSPKQRESSTAKLATYRYLILSFRNGKHTVFKDDLDTIQMKASDADVNVANHLLL